MRGKRGNILTVVLIIIAVAAAAGAFLFFDRGGRSSPPPRGEDTTLEFWICDNVENVDWSDHTMIPGFGVDLYYGLGYEAEGQEEPEVYVRYDVTAWPDYADGGRFITGIEITDPAVTVYGLTTMSDPGEFERVFSDLGFEVERQDTYIRAVKDGFIFTLSITGTPMLKIRAEVTNREGLIF